MENKRMRLTKENNDLVIGKEKAIYSTLIIQNIKIKLQNLF
jgi:hypothetical protein